MTRFKSSSGDASRPAPRYTVLVVDDEPANVNILERILASEYRVLKALGGAEALSFLRATPDDDLVAILSDQRMPGMTGVELLAKAAEERPGAARVLVTGYSDIDAIIAAINVAQVMHYIAKPYEPDTIRQVVRRAVEERERRREGARQVEELRRKNAELEAALAGNRPPDPSD